MVTKSLRKRPIIWFSFLSVLITYVIGIPALIALSPLDEALGLREETLSGAIMRGGPTIAGFIILAAVAGIKGFRVWLAQLFRFNVHPGYYIILYASAVVIFGGSVVLALNDHAAITDAANQVESTGGGALIASYVKELAYITVTNGEETGWRFVMLGLLLVHMRLFPATIILSIVWAFWHFPIFLLQDQLAFFLPLIPIAFCLAVIYGWLYKATHSLLLPILAHGATNATTYTFEREFPELNARLEAVGPLGDWYFAAVAGAVALIIIVFNHRLFFGPVKTKAGEDWAARDAAM